MPNTPDVESNNSIHNLLTDPKLNSNSNTESIDTKQEKNSVKDIKLNDRSNNSVQTQPSLNNSVLYDDDEDNIYDTVAPDEPTLPSNSIDNKKHINEMFDLSSSTDNLSAKYYDLNSYANYVNIDYFLRKEETSSRDDSDDNETHVSQSLSSDHDIEDNLSHSELMKSTIGPIDLHSISSSSLDTKDSVIAPTYDEVFEMDSPDNEEKLSLNKIDIEVIITVIINIH